MKNIKQKKCKNCKGTGFVPLGEGIKGIKECPFCKGTGKIEKEIEKENEEEIKEEFRCSPSIHVKNIYDLKKLLTPFFPQGLAIIIHFILFVSMWVFIFNCCNK